MFKLNGNWTEEVIDDQEAHPFCDTDNQFLKYKIRKILLMVLHKSLFTMTSSCPGIYC